MYPEVRYPPIRHLWGGGLNIIRFRKNYIPPFEVAFGYNIPFWELTPYSNAPNMPYGYLSSFFIALLFPWLFRKIMNKKLIDWDQNYASDAERQLVSEL